MRISPTTPCARPATAWTAWSTGELSANALHHGCYCRGEGCEVINCQASPSRPDSPLQQARTDVAKLMSGQTGKCESAGNLMRPGPSWSLQLEPRPLAWPLRPTELQPSSQPLPWARTSRGDLGSPWAERRKYDAFYFWARPVPLPRTSKKPN